MKTIRLLCLLAWALASILPTATARPHDQIASNLPRPTQPAAVPTASEQPASLAYSVVMASSTATAVVREKAHSAAEAWRELATEWLTTRKKMWILMFLLLLLLARL